jgi:hypothetical protein
MQEKQYRARTSRADNLALLFRFGNTLETAEEQVARVDNGEVNAEVLPERFLDLLALVEAHAPVVDENGLEAVANGFTHQCCAHSAVHAAAAGAEDERPVAHELADARNLELDKVAHFPVGLGPADFDAEVSEHISATRCLRLGVRGCVSYAIAGMTYVFELGVELDT